MSAVDATLSPTPKPEALAEQLAQDKILIEQWLSQGLPAKDQPHCELHAAMHYSVMNGGKRFRPMLTLHVGRCLDVPEAALRPAACALEYLHCYSLVHDDLPAMDDDDWRRGQPTCHKVFGEAMAILAGDALQALAFATLAQTHPNAFVDNFCNETAIQDKATGTAMAAERQLAMLKVLADAAGSLGMAGGQAIDLTAVGQNLTLAELQAMHQRKTGALIKAAVAMPVLVAHHENSDLGKALWHYADLLGLAFQIQDDILDVVGSQEELGKSPGSDAKQAKPTYVSLLGLAGAQAQLRDCQRQVAEVLAPFPQTLLLQELFNYVLKRRH